MFVEEDVGRKTSRFQVSDWENAYNEFKDLIERRFQFMHVQEKKFIHHKDRGMVYSFVSADRQMDDFTKIQLQMEFEIKIGADRKSAEIEMDTKAVVITEYPEETGFQESLVYYAMRSIWDKLVYGWNREKWKKQAEELLVDVHNTMRGMVIVV